MPGFKSATSLRTTSSDNSSIQRKRSSKEIKSNSNDDDFGICLLSESPYRILRVIFFQCYLYALERCFFSLHSDSKSNLHDMIVFDINVPITKFNFPLRRTLECSIWKVCIQMPYYQNLRFILT